MNTSENLYYNLYVQKVDIIRLFVQKNFIAFETVIHMLDECI